MKRKKSAAAAGLLLLAVGLPWAATAQKGGTSAEGSVRLSSEGFQGAIEFSAAVGEDGAASGQVRFTKSAPAPARGGEGGAPPDAGAPRPSLSFNAEVDCLSVVNNKAVMSGVITDSSPAGYAGRRLVLVAVDGSGDGAAVSRDKLTWGVYRRVEKTWTASDAEVENDPGVGLTWVAKDAEREDDPGRPSDEGGAVTCRDLPLSSFSLIELKRGEGDVRVRP